MASVADILTPHCSLRWRSNKPGAGRELGSVLSCSPEEPLLQIDEELLEALHSLAFEIAVETNGTIPTPAGIDWLCVSPKCNARLVLMAGDELKLVYPQIGAEPEHFEVLAFEHLLLQPMDGPEREANTAAAVAYCLANPRWRLSLQTHKFLGIP